MLMRQWKIGCTSSRNSWYNINYMASKGQVMLLTVLVLSGTALAATTIAGILMVYQIRQTTNVSDSAKAIFAADSGIEWEAYKFNKGIPQPAPVFTNGASVETQIIPSSSLHVKSIGHAGKVSRALELTFEP